ncbi:hypothetical protein [Agrobacterium sp. LAD9]|uniref:hypothetical protein n=1 Tax=Agrobacterium sp. LAD9 TaxID=2055153 RepID=UPI0018650D05|nr:hypothetical protein [Agrobacterium sp. LAD9]
MTAVGNHRAAHPCLCRKTILSGGLCNFAPDVFAELLPQRVDGPVLASQIACGAIELETPFELQAIEMRMEQHLVAAAPS